MRDGQGVWLRRFSISLVVGYVVLVLLGPTWGTHYKYEFPDSSSYFDVARRSPFSPRFWFDQRPPTYPLLLWVLGRSHLLVVVAQTGLSIAAWIWLLRVLSATISRRWLAACGGALLVAIALQARWIMWNTLVLTESLSATLAVAGLAAALEWCSDPSRRRMWVLAAVTVGWMCVRDSNATTWLAIAAPAAAVAVVLWRRSPSPHRYGAVVVLGLSVLTGVYSLTAQAITDRGETSFHNNVGLRWLPDEELTGFMVDRGLPLDTALLGRTGRSAWDDGEAFMTAPDLATYRAWAEGRGRVAALSSFVLKAPWYVDRFGDEVEVYAAAGYLFPYDHFGVHDRFPDADLGPLEPVRSLRSVVIWGIVGSGAIALMLAFSRRLGVLVAIVWASVLADSYLSYCADAIEVGRHLAGPWLRFSVVGIVAVAIGLDTWFSARAQRGLTDAAPIELSGPASNEEPASNETAP